MKKDVMSGPRKFGCDMCGRGQRMLEYIEELEEEISDLRARAADSSNESNEPPEDGATTSG